MRQTRCDSIVSGQRHLTTTIEETTMNTTGFTRNYVRNLFLAACAATSLGLTPAMGHGAFGSEGVSPATKTVKYSDLNLATANGVQALYQRIEAAANEVCDTRENRLLKMNSLYRNCMRRSVDLAVTTIGHPALAALHAQRTGQQIERTAQLTRR
jgi:UrcA family protein